MKHQNLILATIFTALILAACSGGSDIAEATAEASTTATPTTSSPTPSEPATTAPIACTAAPINSAEPYSLVFKGCDANNVATYYDKTECVRQNSTGLIWQGHTPTGLRSSLQYYSNHDDVTKNQKYTVTGGALPTVVYVKPTQAEVGAPTNSIGFRNAVNDTKLCGSQTWRMPTQPELSSLIKTGELPTIDNLWFPNSVDWIYWTSSPVPNSENSALEVNFNVGISSFNLRTLGGNAVRLVMQ